MLLVLGCAADKTKMVTRVVMKNNEFMADGVGKGKVAGNVGVKISKGRLEDRSYLSNLQSSSIQTEMEACLF